MQPVEYACRIPRLGIRAPPACALVEDDTPSMIICILFWKVLVYWQLHRVLAQSIAGRSHGKGVEKGVNLRTVAGQGTRYGGG